MTSRAWYKASLKPQGNMRSRTSCICLDNIGPTEVVSIARHWKMGASYGAFFFLLHQPVVDKMMCGLALSSSSAP